MRQKKKLHVENEDSGSKVCEKENLRSDETMDVEIDEVENEIFNEEENIFKVPTVKRKSNSGEAADKSKKKMQNENNMQMSDVSVSGIEQKGSEASVEDKVSQDRSGYGLEQMKKFLQSTKGMRNVEVIDFFP